MLNNIKTKILFVFPLFLALYFIFNLLGGERGLFSYFDKKNILNKLITQKNNKNFKQKKIQYQFC